MILKKPYAFLIKHFKLIHLILTGLVIYSTYRTYQLYKFVEYYIAEGWVTGLNFTAETYVDILMYLAIIVIISLSAIIMLLMKKKEKPTMIYLVNIVIYFVIFLSFIFSFVILSDMETKTMDTRTLSLLSDINLGVFVIQILISIFGLFRGFGFDIKKFNFGEDIAQLKIEMADSEEVEVNINVNTDNILTTMRKKRREFKYVYQENKFVINIFAGLLVLVVASAIYINITVYNKVYKENEMFRAKDFNAVITDSYYTKKDYKGEVITDKNSTYLVIKLSVTNLLNTDQSFDYKTYKLVSGSAVYTPNTSKYDSLFDIGYGYKGEEIEARKTKKYILTYLVDDRSLKNKAYIRYTNKINFYVGSMSASYKKIDVKPTNIDKPGKLITTVKLNETLAFDKSLLNKSTVLIKGLWIRDSFTYDYEICRIGKCQTYHDIIKPTTKTNYNKTILALDVKYNLDEYIELKGIDSNFDFVSKLSTLVYTVNGVTKSHKIKLYDQTPVKGTETRTYFEVLKEVENATKISLIFSVRESIYVYVLKE